MGCSRARWKHSPPSDAGDGLHFPNLPATGRLRRSPLFPTETGASRMSLMFLIRFTAAAAPQKKARTTRPGRFCFVAQAASPQSRDSSRLFLDPRLLHTQIWSHARQGIPKIKE